MNSVLGFFSGLSVAQLALFAAFAILFFILIVLFWPSNKNQNENQSMVNPAPSKKNKNAFSRKEPGWDSSRSNNNYSNSANASNSFLSNNSYEEKPKKPSLFSRIFGSKDKAASELECIPTKVGFTHPNVTDHFKELVKPGPASDLKTPDTDELDQIFTTMLKAGAVTSRPHLVTNFEHQYLEKLRIWFSYRCYIFCQVSVGSVISINTDVNTSLTLPQRLKFAQKCQNMSFDFLLVEKSTERIVCAIELDDPTHMRADRISRDRRLDKLCAAANIPIFHITNIYHKPDLRRMIKTAN